MLKPLLTLSFFVSNILSAFSQEAQWTVSGTVGLSDSLNRDQITATLLSLSGTVVASDKADTSGRYTLQAAAGSYTIRLYHLGYTAFESRIELIRDIQMPEILLQSQATALEEVVITPEVAPVFNPRGYTLAIAANPVYRELAFDNILNLTPGTQVGRGSITLFGKNIQKVFLDGRELSLRGSELIDFLATYDGKQIKHIELVSTSGVQEDASAMGGAILRITTIKVDDGGMLLLGGNTNVGRDVFSRGGNLNGQYRVGNWSVYGLGSLINVGGARPTSTEIDFIELQRYINTDNQVNSRTPFAVNSTFGVGYDRNGRTFIGLEGAFRTNARESDTRVSTTQRDGLSGSFLPLSSGTMSGTGGVEMNRLTFNLTHSFEPSAKLIIQADRLQNKVEQNQDNHYHYEESADFQIFRTDNLETNLIHTVRADLEKTLARRSQTLDFGVKYTDFDTKNDMTVWQNRSGDIFGGEDTFLYSERLLALYASHGVRWEALRLSWGARLEQSTIHPRSLSDPGPSTKRTALDVFPEVALSLTLDEKKNNSLAFSYTRSISRPSMSSLNPTVLQDNPFSYSQGNSLLHPTFPNKLSVRLMLGGKFIFTTDLTQSRNESMSFTYVDEDNGELISTQENQLDRYSWSTYAEYPIDLGQIGQIKLSSQFSRNHQSNVDRSMQSNRWSLSANGRFSLPYKITVMPDISYASASRGLYYRSNSSVYSNVVFSRSFLQNSLTAGLHFHDLFNSIGGSRRDTFFPTHRQRNRNEYTTFSVIARATYTLRWGNRGARVNRASSGSRDEEIRTTNQL